MHTPFRSRLILGCLCLLAGALLAPRGLASPPPSSTDFFVSADFEGYPNLIEEFTADGRLVQTIAVPANTGAYSSEGTEYLRGIAATDAGEIVGFNGTFSPQLTTLHPRPSALTARTAPAWKIANNVSSGTVAALRGYSFVITESFNSGDPPAAIIRFNPDGTSQEFAVAGPFDSGYINLTAGLDGKLYALHSDHGSQSAAYYADVFDPATLQKLNTVHLQVPFAVGSQSTDVRNLAVDARGSIYAIELYNRVYHLDPAGALLQSASHGQGGYTEDIKIDPNTGRLLISIGGYGAKVLQTDPALSSFQTLVQLDPNKDEEVFLTFSNPKVAAGLLPTARILWNNPDGRATLWYVNTDGSYGLVGAYGPYVDAGGVWRASAVATGPNGVSRILWTNPDGRATLWFVNPDGSHGLSGAYGPYVDSGGVWKAGALSVGPDNAAHILWTNPDGRATLWYVNPDASYGLIGAYGPYTDSGGVWKAAAVATGPNGVSRILWDNPDGRVTLWYVNTDGSYGVSGAYGPYTDAGGIWKAGALSVGPDNVAHILWGNPDGRATLWFVNPDASYGLIGAYGPYSDPFSSGGLWNAAALATDPSGVSRILWANPNGRATLWFVNPDGSYGDQGVYGPYADKGGTWQAGADAAGP